MSHRDFLKNVTSYCQLEYWDCEEFLHKFLRPLRLAYKNKHRVVGITIWTSRRGIDDLTTEQGASLVNIISEVSYRELVYDAIMCTLHSGAPVYSNSVSFA